MNNAFKYNKIASAFSLIEMLMALLVASLLMAALAPVMTKRMNENIKVNGLGETYKAPADMQCFSYNDAQASVNVSVNDVYSASFIIASGGGGGAGATSTNKIAANPVQVAGTTSADNKTTINITEYMTDVKVTLAGGGGGGAGGAGYVSVCPNGTYEFKGSSTVKPFCITQFNVGEHRNNIQQRTQDYIPKCPSCAYYGAYDVSASWDSKCGSSQKGMCCWYAYDNTHLTANPEQCASAAGYNSCARTVCQYKAAETGCNDFTYVPSGVQSVNWSLPNSNQVTYLKDTYNSNISILGGKGAFLCSGDYLSGVDLCGLATERCWGSDYADHTNICYPSGLWVKEQKMIWMLVKPSIGGNGLYGPFSANVASAFSARCTLEKTNLFKSYSGAGGSAGASLIDLDITEYVKQAGIGGTIELTAGKAGTGGSGAASNNTKASDGTAGNHSLVIIKKQTGEIIYGARVSGGNSGRVAQNITPTGAAAANSSSFPNEATSGCQYTTDGAVWTNGACTKWTLIGDKGDIVWGSNASAPYAKGGDGANSPIISTTARGAGGSGVSVSALNGGSPAATSYGAGGGGGSSIYDYNDKIITGKGGNGAGGLAKITYNNEYAAAGGGGGGAGSIAVIKDLQVGKAAECTLTMGKGGKGGNVDNDGYDGQESSVKCNTDTRTFSVPGGKGGKKGTPASSAAGAGVFPIGGKEGLFVDINKEINSAVKNYNNSKKVILNGSNGIAGNKTIGGRGGTSGTGTKGACGGLYVEEDETKGVCKVSETDAKRINGEGFVYEDTVTPNAKDIQNTANASYGKAGAGGGGGGWIRELGSGKGGDGMNGYVCIYWYNEGS